MNDDDQLTPSATVPTAISVEPPPTSTTPTTPGSSRPSVRVAPRKASRASSAPSRISTSTVMPSTNSSRLTAARIAAVATTRTWSAPAVRASSTCSATTRATSAIFSGAITGRRADARERAALEHLGEAPAGHVGDEHAGRVRADVDARTEHEIGGDVAMMAT